MNDKVKVQLRQFRTATVVYFFLIIYLSHVNKKYPFKGSQQFSSLLGLQLLKSTAAMGVVAPSYLQSTKLRKVEVQRLWNERSQGALYQ